MSFALHCSRFLNMDTCICTSIKKRNKLWCSSTNSQWFLTQSLSIEMIYQFFNPLREITYNSNLFDIMHSPRFLTRFILTSGWTSILCCIYPKRRSIYFSDFSTAKDLFVLPICFIEYASYCYNGNIVAIWCQSTLEIINFF